MLLRNENAGNGDGEGWGWGWDLQCYRMVRKDLTETLTFEKTPEGGEGVNLAHLWEEDHYRQR